MKEIKTLSKRINEQLAEIERINGKADEAERVAESATHAVATLTDLRQQRARELAAAVVEKRAPDTANIEVRIADAESVVERAHVQADEARTMGEAFRARLAELQCDLELLQSQRRGVAIAEMERLRSDAIDEYVAAVEALGPIVARIKAADRMIRIVNPSDALPQVMPGELLFNRIHAERMPVPWSHSDRQKPERRIGLYSAPRNDGQYMPVMDSPKWMRGDALVKAEVAVQRESLCAAGFEI